MKSQAESREEEMGKIYFAIIEKIMRLFGENFGKKMEYMEKVFQPDIVEHLIAVRKLPNFHKIDP